VCVVACGCGKTPPCAHDQCNDHTVHGAVFRFTGDEDDPYGSLTTRRDYAYEP